MCILDSSGRCMRTFLFMGKMTSMSEHEIHASFEELSRAGRRLNISIFGSVLAEVTCGS